MKKISILIALFILVQSLCFGYNRDFTKLNDGKAHRIYFYAQMWDKYIYLKHLPDGRWSVDRCFDKYITDFIWVLYAANVWIYDHKEIFYRNPFKPKTQWFKHDNLVEVLPTVDHILGIK